MRSAAIDAIPAARHACRCGDDAEFFAGMSKTWGLTFQINDEKAPTAGVRWAGLANASSRIDPRDRHRRGLPRPGSALWRPKDDPLYWAFETAFYA